MDKVMSQFFTKIIKNTHTTCVWKCVVLYHEGRKFGRGFCDKCRPELAKWAIGAHSSVSRCSNHVRVIHHHRNARVHVNSNFATRLRVLIQLVMGNMETFNAARTATKTASTEVRNQT